MGVGVCTFLAGMAGGVLLLREGVTGLVGEGERLPAESPEQVCHRQSGLAGFLGAIVVGWVLARLGDSCQQPAPQLPRASRLAAGVLMLLGGVGLATGALLWSGPAADGHQVPSAYHLVGNTAAVCGPILLGLGRRSFVAASAGRIRQKRVAPPVGRRVKSMPPPDLIVGHEAQQGNDGRTAQQ
jgi:hypothetical protein